MSLFYCHQCDDLCDADDGCEEAPNGIDLICVACAAEMEDDAPSEPPEKTENEGNVKP